MPPESNTCPTCSSEARPADRFCSQCGTALGGDENRDLKGQIELGRFFELAVDVFVVTGPDGRFALVNPAMSRLLGVDREVILSQPWSAFVHEDDRERSASENAREFALGHRTVTFENRYVDIHGGIHWMDWNAELDPATGFVYGIARDMTEQRAAREALEEARKAADAANRAKSEFLSRMSHELRTPLNAVLGFAQVLELDGLNELQSEYVGHITRGGQHLLELIDDVMHMSRIEIGAITISVEPVGVAEVVADVLSLLGPLAAKRQIALRSTLSEDEPTHVLADRQWMTQVLVNFLSNAIKYTPPGSSATVASVPAGDEWIRISVSDDGPGIPEELVDRLFSPFERIGAERTSVEGTGLGLAHSKVLAEQMGGRIGVTSNVGQGSVFWMELPVAVAAPEPEATPANEPATSGRPATTGTLLYIEDNPSNLRLVERALSHRPGVELLSATLASRGIELARERRPGLVLLDLHLPDMGGEGVLRTLRSDARTKAIPIVILSADATSRQIDLLLSLGASAYLTKPIDLRALLSTVDHHLADA
jgi:PAS domain S-box-containing protein